MYGEREKSRVRALEIPIWLEMKVLASRTRGAAKRKGDRKEVMPYVDRR